MKWINPYGLFFMAVILIPNMVFAVKCPQGFENAWENKTVERLEQIGRFGCFGFMVVHIPSASPRTRPLPSTCWPTRP